MGGPTSTSLRLNRNGTTRELRIALDNAPASKMSQDDVRFSGVRQTTPKFDFSSCSDNSWPQRSPAEMSCSDIHTSSPWITMGSQRASASATDLLRSPDQLMKTFATLLILSGHSNFKKY